jgi:LacI family transcriptional regulator
MRRKYVHIALLVDTATSWGRRLITGVTSYSRQVGPWSIWIEDHGQDEQLRLPPGWRGDGVIARVTSTEMARQLKRAHVPVVNISGVQLPSANFPRVTSDAHAVGRLAVQEFLNRGFRNLAYVDGSNRSYISSRYEAFNEFAKRAGHMTFHYSAERRAKFPTWEAQQTDLMRWLRELPKPVGITTFASRRGNEIIDACRRAKVAVPDEVAVLGGDNDEVICEASHPPLSGVIIPSEQMGFEAAALLHRLMHGKKPPKKPILIQPTGIVTRRSTDVLAIDDVDVATAIRVIREHAVEGIRVEEILREVAISRSSLERRFHQILGRSPAAELQRVRLEAAKRLLAESDMTMFDVAAASGFGSAEYMSFVFHRSLRLTPAKFRTAMRGH